MCGNGLRSLAERRGGEIQPIARGWNYRIGQGGAFSSEYLWPDWSSDHVGFRTTLFMAKGSAPTVFLAVGGFEGSPINSGEHTEENVYITITNNAYSNVAKYQYSTDNGKTWYDMPETNIMEDYTSTNGTAKFKITQDLTQEYKVRAILEDENETLPTSFTINKKIYNYQVGNTGYSTLAEAYAGAKQQGRSDIAVLRDVTDSTTLTLDTRDVNLDLQSYTITRNSGIITVANGKTMTITGSTSGNNTGTITSTNQSTITVTEGTLNINSGNMPVAKLLIYTMRSCDAINSIIR